MSGCQQTHNHRDINGFASSTHERQPTAESCVCTLAGDSQNGEMAFSVPDESKPMAYVYNVEPNTNGKVVLHTTAGDVDIELWSEQAPLACRNFVQLCLEHYYDKTLFHRVIKKMMIQGGDPTGTGQGIVSLSPFTCRWRIHLGSCVQRRVQSAFEVQSPRNCGNGK